MKEFNSLEELERYAHEVLFDKETCYFLKEELTLSYIRDKFKNYSNVVLDFEDVADDRCFTSSKNFFNRREVYIEIGENQYTLHFKTTPVSDDVVEEYFNSL